MMLQMRSAPVLATALGWLASAGLVFAVQPALRDDGHFFSADAVSQAEQAIQEIKQRYNQNLVIETFAKVSPVARLFHNLKDPAGRARFFADWAQRNARKAGPTSIYVLICREPGPVHVEVVVGRETQAGAFVAKDRDQLQERLDEQVREGRYDAGLLKTVHFVQATLRTHLGSAVAPPAPFPWESILTTVLVMLAFWLCAETVRGIQFSKARASDARVGPPGYGSYGSIPTALFASMTCNWLRDLLRGGSPKCPGELSAPAAPAEPEIHEESADHLAEPSEFHDAGYYHSASQHEGG
jgi:hypothetical protein